MLGNVLDGLHHAGEEFAVLLPARREGDPAVAEQRGGDAVPSDGRHLGVPADLRIEVRVQVDESRRDDVSLGIDFLGTALVHPTHGRDGVAVNGDVGFDRFVAGSVDYGAIPDY